MDNIEDLPTPLNLILRELDDIKTMIRGIARETQDHAKLDNERFDEVKNTLANWRGAALVIVALVSGLVSALVGIVVKHF